MSEWKLKELFSLPEEELEKMTNEEFSDYLSRKPPPSQEFLDWEKEALTKQVAAGLISQAEMDKWLALRTRGN